MKHYVRTVEGCTPRLYEFTSKKKQQAFLDKFRRTRNVKTNNPDYWLDLVFSGDIGFSDLEVIKSAK